MVDSDTLQWRHVERDGVSNYWCLDCLPNRLFKHRSKKTSKIRVTVVCEGNPPVTGGSPHKGSVTRIMFSFDDVIIHANRGLTPGLSHQAGRWNMQWKWSCHPHRKDFGLSFEETEKPQNIWRHIPITKHVDYQKCRFMFTHTHHTNVC